MAKNSLKTVKSKISNENDSQQVNDNFYVSITNHEQHVGVQYIAFKQRTVKHRLQSRVMYFCTRKRQQTLASGHKQSFCSTHASKQRERSFRRDCAPFLALLTHFNREEGELIALPAQRDQRKARDVSSSQRNRKENSSVVLRRLLYFLSALGKNSVGCESE